MLSGDGTMRNSSRRAQTPPLGVLYVRSPILVRSMQPAQGASDVGSDSRGSGPAGDDSVRHLPAPRTQEYYSWVPPQPETPTQAGEGSRNALADDRRSRSAGSRRCCGPAVSRSGRAGSEPDLVAKVAEPAAVLLRLDAAGAAAAGRAATVGERDAGQGSPIAVAMGAIFTPGGLVAGESLSRRADRRDHEPLSRRRDPAHASGAGCSHDQEHHEPSPHDLQSCGQGPGLGVRPEAGATEDRGSPSADLPGGSDRGGLWGAGFLARFAGGVCAGDQCRPATRRSVSAAPRPAPLDRRSPDSELPREEDRQGAGRPPGP